MEFLHAHSQSLHVSYKTGPPVFASAAQLRVLVVDDCPVDRLLACAVLSQWGIAPKIARNGEEAVELACGEVFDLILMDLTMPVMDGFAATRIIRRFERARPFRPAVPVLAYADDEDHRPMRGAMLLHSGLDGVLKKPCDSLRMAACLERWCSGRFKA